MIRSNVRRFGFLTCTFLMTVCFQNCGQEVTFDEGLQKGAFSQLNSQGETTGIDSLDASDIIELVAINNENPDLDFESEVPPMIDIPSQDNQTDSGQSHSDDNSHEESADQVADTNSTPDPASSANENGQQQAEENRNENSTASTSETDDGNSSANDHGQQTADAHRNSDQNTDNDSENDSEVDSDAQETDQPLVTNNNEDDTENENSDDSSHSDVPTTNPETYMFRCVLQGKGKSQHIGFIGDRIVGDQDTPDTLCMSENACLNIMPSLGFAVQGPQFTGYCKNAKAHTQTLTDSQAFALVAE